MENDRPKLQNIVTELRTPGYVERAQQRVQRRKSPWNLLLIPFGIGGVQGLRTSYYRLCGAFIPRFTQTTPADSASSGESVLVFRRLSRAFSC